MSWHVLVAAMLLPALASAEEPRFRFPPLVPELHVELQAIPAGEDSIVVLEKGKPSPFSGQLFSNDTALRWGNWLEQYRIQAPLLLETQRSVCVAELRYRDSVLAIRQETSEAVQQDLRGRLVSVERRNALLQAELLKGPPWYNSRTFGIIVGAAGTLGVTVLSIWAIDSAAR